MPDILLHATTCSAVLRILIVDNRQRDEVPSTFARSHVLHLRRRQAENGVEERL